MPDDGSYLKPKHIAYYIPVFSNCRVQCWLYLYITMKYCTKIIIITVIVHPHLCARSQVTFIPCHSNITKLKFTSQATSIGSLLGQSSGPIQEQRQKL